MCMTQDEWVSFFIIIVEKKPKCIAVLKIALDSPLGGKKPTLFWRRQDPELFSIIINEVFHVIITTRGDKSSSDYSASGLTNARSESTPGLKMFRLTQYNSTVLTRIRLKSWVCLTGLQMTCKFYFSLGSNI